MTVAELKKIWEPEAQGRITRWSQVRAGWPDEELRLFGAGVDSGTYDYFTEAIVGKEHASRGDFQSSEDDNVLVQGVGADRYALGFFGYAYYEENKARLKLLGIDDGRDDNGAGCIAPSRETVEQGRYQPLSRPLFVYVHAGAAKRPEIRKFVEFYLDQAPALVSEVGYTALPAEAYRLAKRRYADGVTGSLFGGKGSQVGVTIVDLLKRETP
jgi:phosphate transport system substrate-binding protein